MPLRRAPFFALLLATIAGLTVQAIHALAPLGWNPLTLLILLCFAATTPWLGICVGNAVPGFLVLLFARNPPRAVLPIPAGADIDHAPITARTAIAVTIRSEDMQATLPPLRRLLAALTPPDRFALFLLSDTPAPATAEAAAIAAFAAEDPARIHYRRRAGNTGFKAGNVMDFLDHHAEGFELALMLDADSDMTADAVRRLVRIMQAAPGLGLVQHLTTGRPTSACFPRLFQFGMRAGMRVWATGQALWQGDEGPYWGHNAVLRIAPFRAHCRLEPLPDGSAILSHDQVEAARLRAAGWGVALWASEDGSQEANPPALPEFLHRDARWLAGNLQYRHLVALPGLRPMGRWQLVQAMLMFAVAPLHTALFLLAALAAATGASAPAAPLLGLMLAATLAVYSPKLLGYAEILASPAKSARYGGRARFAAGAALECLFMLAVDAIGTLHKTLAMLRLALGAKPSWLPQNRSARRISWAEAASLFWPHTLFGLLGFAIPWSLPLAGGLLLAIPLCVLSARDIGWVATIPEEKEAAPV